jgi:phospholipid/cholesterol/gamma-HCH transport system substrate-binding protein
MTRKWPELLTGSAVIIVAIVFLVYALGRADAVNTGGYPLRAQFSSIGSLSAGADVKIGGVIVGHVADTSLDPTTYAALVKLDVDNDIKIPTDSSATIASDGLLGGSYISISPGGSDKMMAPDQAFAVTQSAINIEDLLGKFIFSMGSSSGKPASGSGSGAAPATPAPANPAALPIPGK